MWLAGNSEIVTQTRDRFSLLALKQALHDAPGPTPTFSCCEDDGGVSIRVGSQRFVFVFLSLLVAAAFLRRNTASSLARYTTRVGKVARRYTHRGLHLVFLHQHLVLVILLFLVYCSIVVIYDVLGCVRGDVACVWRRGKQQSAWVAISLERLKKPTQRTIF